MSVSYRNVIVSLVFLLWTAASGAAEIFVEPEVKKDTLTVTASVNKKEIDVNEVFTYTLLIKGPLQRSPKIQLPELKDFSVLGSSQSQGFSLKEGSAQAHIAVEYLLQPKAAGVFTISAATVTVPGQPPVQSQALTITVTGSLPRAPRQTPVPKKIPIPQSGEQFVL